MHSVDQTGFKLGDPPASVSAGFLQSLGLETSFCFCLPGAGTTDRLCCPVAGTMAAVLAPDCHLSNLITSEDIGHGPPSS